MVSHYKAVLYFQVLVSYRVWTQWMSSSPWIFRESSLMLSDQQNTGFRRLSQMLDEPLDLLFHFRGLHHDDSCERKKDVNISLVSYVKTKREIGVLSMFYETVINMKTLRALPE